MEENEKIISKRDIRAEHFAELGMQVKVSPKSMSSINKPGYKLEYLVESVSVTIGIGNDHIAELIMDKDAWIALNNGEKVHVTTMKEYKDKYVHPIKKKKA